MKHLYLALGIIAGLLSVGSPASADQLAQAAPAPSPSPSASPNPFQMSGFLDLGETWASASAPNGVISGRVFDTLSGTPQLHALNLQASYAGPIGGKLEFTIGDDAEYIHSYPQLQQAFGPQYSPSTPSLYAYGPGLGSRVDLTQAYAAYNGSKLTVIAGKFATLAGAEVIESPSDLEISRSILFGFAIPFTHTGVRATYAATPNLSLVAGANRGWDTTKTLPAATNGSGGIAGDNSSLTFEYGAAWNPSKAFALNATGYSGKPENWAFAGCANTSCQRNLIDLVATYHYNSAITAILNVDIANQSNTLLPGFTAGAPALVSATATWKGVAGYVSDAFSSKLTGTVRYEQFVDDQGYRIFGGGVPGALGTRWNEGTVTVQYAPLANLTLRAEGRFDNASQPIFVNKTGIQSSLSTFGLEAIVHAP